MRRRFSTRDQPFSEREVVGIMSEIIVFLDALHDKNLLYSGLKLENVTITHTGHIQIVDLGFAQHYRHGDVPLCALPPIVYIPPEALDDNCISDARDIWTIGIITYELLTGET